MSVRRPRWLAPTALALALVGLAVSAYLSFEHLTENASLVCPGGGAASSCVTVTTSRWSMVAGIPVAYLGFAFYVVVVAACLPSTWRTSRWDPARLVLLVAGLGFVLYLVWAELFQISAICTWCSVVHVVTLILLVVVAAGQILSEPTSSSPT